MSAEKNLSVSKIIPISRALQRITATNTSTLGINLTRHMATRFPTGMEEISIIGIPTLLDPRFKKLAFTSRSSAEKIAGALLNEMKTVCQHQPDRQQGQTTNLEPDYHSDSPVWQFFDKQVIPANAINLRTCRGGSIHEDLGHFKKGGPNEMVGTKPK